MRTRLAIVGLCLLISAGALLLSRPFTKGNTDASSNRRAGGRVDARVQDNLQQGKKPNRLIREKSPYLLRHAFDPVDWNPWGDEAFETAKKLNKPIFLSIGYASCFACYSMQRDVFENRKIADQMNSDAVNILVDREERPDIDRIYMSVLQTTSGSGGWPMSFFLTPDRKPFFGAMYLSAPAFTGILSRVREIWQSQPQKLFDSGELFASYLKESTGGRSPDAKAEKDALRRGFGAFREVYDSQFAGFGSAPKFPHPMILSFLLRYFYRTHEKAALEMTLATLRQMSDGAIFDHVGYGFHRYSGDDQWRTPHFEKMLYDQALLTISYLEAFQMTHDSQYSTTARNTLTYVQRELASPEGGFYGAQDAASAWDAQHPESRAPGAYYVWTKGEIDRILGLKNASVFDFVFGIRPEGNSLHDPLNTLTNHNVLFRSHTDHEAALQFHKSDTEIRATVNNNLQTLFAERLRRPKPEVDDKVILSWNALMISAFARASEVLEDTGYMSVAERCNDFLDHRLRVPATDKLLRRYRNGEARYPANLQDYAFYVQALLDLYEASFNIKFLKSAIPLSDQMIELFEDREKGGFFDTAAMDRSLPVRAKEFYDDSEPAGNSIAILDLLRIAQITAGPRYRNAADRALRYFSGRMMDQPEAMPQMLIALEFSLEKPKQVIIAGAADNPLTKTLLKEVHSRFLPDKILLLADGGEGQKLLSEFLPVLSQMRMLDGKPTAYVCENYVCKLPTSNARVVASELEDRAPR